MRSTSRVARLALAVATGLALMVAVSSPAAAVTGSGNSAATVVMAGTTAGPGPTWVLKDFSESQCVSAEFGRWTYFMVQVSGTWSTTLYASLADFPEGSETMIIPIQPGAYRIHLIPVTIPPIPVGMYAAELQVTDGTVTQTSSIELRSQGRCP